MVFSMECVDKKGKIQSLCLKAEEHLANGSLDPDIASELDDSKHIFTWGQYQVVQQWEGGR